MKKNKSKKSIEEIRKNSKWLKLFENVPYNNSKVGETFIMKVSSRKNIKQILYINTTNPDLIFLKNGQKDLFKRNAKVSTERYFQDGAKRIEA